MMNGWSVRICAASLVFVIGACGGDGSSVPQGPTGALPPPTSTPTPSSTATPVASIYPPPPFNLAGPQQFTIIGWTVDETGQDMVDTNRYRFGWGSNPSTYRLTTPQFADGLFKYTFPGNNPSEFRIYRPDGTDTSVTAYVTVNRLYARDFRYTGWLTWSDYKNFGDVLFGQATEAANIPTSGSATFRMDVAAEPWDIVVDFAARTVTGKVAISWSDAWGPYPPFFYDLEDGQLDPQSGKISAKFSIPGTDIPGVLKGQLMGPSANELALAVSGAVRNPYDERFETVRFTAPGERLP